MFLFIIVCYALYCTASNSQDIGGKVKNYFISEGYHAFQKFWYSHRKSYENAIVLALKESYGHRDMNIYLRRSINSLKLAEGFYVCDNVVELMLYDLYLKSIPQLLRAEVNFALASNILRVKLDLRKIIIETNYLLFRNTSNMLYSADQDPYKTSPFSFLQVENKGHLAIVAEGCTLLGNAIAKLSGDSIDLGHNTFRISNCQFHVEISALNSKSPPVIAPYFGDENREALEKLLTRPISQEVISVLQSCMYSYINTSMIFGSYLPSYMKAQNDIFEDTAKHFKELVRLANKATIKRNLATISLPPFKLLYNLTTYRSTGWNYISITNTTVYGMDSLYSAHEGGPYKSQLISLGETIRFYSLMIRGKLFYENATAKGDLEFVSELKDVQVTVDINTAKGSSARFVVMSWRLFELSVVGLELYVQGWKATSALVSGYLTDALPVVLKKHLEKTFKLNNDNNSQFPSQNAVEDNKADIAEERALDGEGSSKKDEERNDNAKERAVDAVVALAAVNLSKGHLVYDTSIERKVKGTRSERRNIKVKEKMSNSSRKYSRNGVNFKKLTDTNHV